jgi:hypothetical protein
MTCRFRRHRPGQHGGEGRTNRRRRTKKMMMTSTTKRARCGEEAGEAQQATVTGTVEADRTMTTTAATATTPGPQDFSEVVVTAPVVRYGSAKRVRSVPAVQPAGHWQMLTGQRPRSLRAA